MSAEYGGVVVGRQRQEPQWERTPWWVFWRPYWRRRNPNYWDTIGRYEYRSKRQLAHEFLEKQFSNEKPFNRTYGGGRRAKF